MTLIEKKLIEKNYRPQIHPPPNSVFEPALVGAGQQGEAVHVAVEHQRSPRRPPTFEKTTTATGRAQAHIVTHRQDLDFGKRRIQTLFVNFNNDILDYLVAILPLKIEAQPLIQYIGAVGPEILQGNHHFRVAVGSSSPVDRREFEDIVERLNPGPGSDKNAELPQGPGTVFVGKDEADLARQHRPTQIDLHRPLVGRVSRVGLPIGPPVAVDDKIRRLRVALGLPDPTHHLAALLSRVAKIPSIGQGVDPLAKLPQAQPAALVYLYQVVWHLPGLPSIRAVEAKHFGAHRNCKPRQHQ